jgi:hypothetical protein
MNGRGTYPTHNQPTNNQRASESKQGRDISQTFWGETQLMRDTLVKDNVFQRVLSTIKDKGGLGIFITSLNYVMYPLIFKEKPCLISLLLLTDNLLLLMDNVCF